MALPLQDLVRICKVQTLCFCIDNSENISLAFELTHSVIFGFKVEHHANEIPLKHFEKSICWSNVNVSINENK